MAKNSIQRNNRVLVWDSVLTNKRLNDGIAYLKSEIECLATTSLFDEIHYIESLRPKIRIKLEITSPGGSTYHALAIYDRIRQSIERGHKVTGFVYGVAASAASMIVLQACSERVATPMSRFLVHEVRNFKFLITEKTSDVEDDLEEMKGITTQVLNILSIRMKMPSDEVQKLFKRKEYWMDAKEALKIGLIDRVE